MKYTCDICGWEYDEALGYPEGGIAPGTKYKNADAMLVTLAKDPLISMTIPGKVQTYMAAGKPVIGAIDGETPKIVEEAGCGFCSPSGDYIALSENIRRFLESDIGQLGENSAKYYEEHFRKDKFIDTLLKELGEVEPV